MPEESKEKEQPTLAEANALLREEVERLHHELRESRKVQKITVERIVPPRDYEQTKRKCEMLMEQNHSYRAIIEHGSITVIEGLVERYIMDSKAMFRKIITEVSITNFSRNTADEVEKLIEHFNNMTMQLRTLVAVQSGGHFVFQPKLRSAQAKAEEISRLMNSISTLHGLTERKTDELLATLTSMSDFLTAFIDEVRGDD